MPFARAALIALGAAAVIAAGVVATRTLGPASAPPPPPLSGQTSPPGSGPRLFYPPGRPAVLTLPDGAQERVYSVLNVPQRLRFGAWVWNEDGVAPGRIWVRVDLRRQLLSVFRGGHEIGTAVILYGIRDKESPTGTFPVLQKARDYHSITYDAAMPYMMRLTADGVAIHGSEVRPGAATHGCIGVPESFARRLYGVVQVGDRVTILDPNTKT